MSQIVREIVRVCAYVECDVEFTPPKHKPCLLYHTRACQQAQERLNRKRYNQERRDNPDTASRDRASKKGFDRRRAMARKLAGLPTAYLP